METVRFYERVGLIHKPPRRDSGYRQYPEKTARQLRVIRRAKELGFTLREIKEPLRLWRDIPSTATCNGVRKLAEEKIADMREKIRILQRMEAVSTQLVCDCRNRAVTDDCPILAAIEQEAST